MQFNEQIIAKEANSRSQGVSFAESSTRSFASHSYTIYCCECRRKCTVDFLRVRRPWVRPWHWNPSGALIYTGRWTLRTPAYTTTSPSKQPSPPPQPHNSLPAYACVYVLVYNEYNERDTSRIKVSFIIDFPWSLDSFMKMCREQTFDVLARCYWFLFHWWSIYSQTVNSNRRYNHNRDLNWRSFKQC